MGEGGERTLQGESRALAERPRIGEENYGGVTGQSAFKWPGQGQGWAVHQHPSAFLRQPLITKGANPLSVPNLAR